MSSLIRSLLDSSSFDKERMSPFLRHHRWLDEAPTDDSSDGTDWTSLVITNFFLFCLIFGLSASVDAKNLISQLHNKWAILTGIGMQFFIMPILGFLSVMIFKSSDAITQAMGIALLVVTSSPGGSYSNWWCSTFNADLALSVAMTAVSTVLSVGMLPANLLLYSYLAFGVSEEENIVDALDFGAIFLSLGIVIAAILTGLYASYKMHSRSFQLWSNRIGSVSGIVLILVSAFLSSGTGDAESSFWSQPWEFYVMVAIPCLLGIVLANVLSRCFRLDRPECVSVSIECCYQNTGIATSVAVNMFSDPTERAQALAVPLFYGILEAIVIGIYCVWAWKVGWTKAPAGEKLCVVVTHTYELDRPVPQAEAAAALTEEGPAAAELEGDLQEQPQCEGDSNVEAAAVEGVADEDVMARTPERATEPPLEELTGWRRWYHALFEPRYPYGHSRSQREAMVEPEEDNKKGEDVDLEQNKKDRDRFVSEDYTAATSGSSSLSSPPVTPGGSLDILPVCDEPDELEMVQES